MKNVAKKKKKNIFTPAVKIAIFLFVCVLTVATCGIIAFKRAAANADSVVEAVDAEGGINLIVADSGYGQTLINYDRNDDVSDRSIDIDGDDSERTIPGDEIIEPGDDIDVGETELEAPVNIYVTVDGHRYSLLTRAETVKEALDEQNIEVGASDIVNGADLGSNPVPGMKITIIRVSSDTRVEVETIPYETVYVWDETMMEGEYYTLTRGKNGSITRTYTLIYEDGVLVSDELTDVDRVEKVNERIAYGSRSSFSNSRGERIDYTKCIVCYGTAYIPDAKWGYQTYVGERARPGVVAVDPDVIPLGTKLYIECPYSDIGDYGYAIAWDIGGHVKGNWVDLFVEYIDIARVWGARDVNVYILEDQSVDIFALRSDYFAFMED